MALHLFYKEWLKTKWFVLASLLLSEISDNKIYPNQNIIPT